MPARPELVALYATALADFGRRVFDAGDIVRGDEGLVVTLRRSKGDQTVLRNQPPDGAFLLPQLRPQGGQAIPP